MVRVTPLPHLFRQRFPFRANRLYAILDATSFDNLLIEIGKSGLEFESLFSGEDALVLSGEAPYIVALDPAKPKAVRDLLQAAKLPHAGFIIETDASIDDLRRHYASWLNVTIEEGTQMALFRFYDTRILLAFLGTLQATDAAAFWGPADRFYALKASVPSVITRPTLSGPARIAAPLEQPYAVNAQQMGNMSMITDQAFRTRLESYLATEWADDVGDTDLAAMIATVIADDCPRLEVCREMDIVMMAITRLRMPDLVASASFWDAVIDQRPNPNQRAGAFLSRLTVGLDNEQKIAFGRRVNGWWQFDK